MRTLSLLTGLVLFAAGLATGVYDGLHWEWQDGLFPSVTVGDPIRPLIKRNAI